MKVCKLDYLKSITPGNNDFAIQILRLFLKDTPVSIAGMKLNLERSNWSELYAHAHKIKPSVSLIGMPQDLIDLLLKIIDFAKNETDIENITPLFEQFDLRMSLIYADLQESLDEMEN